MLQDRVLFLDGEAIIIDKPAGLAVDPPRNGGLSLQNHLASLTFGFRRWPAAVHRLDRDTSGCLLLARNPGAHKRFTAAFAARTVQKLYLAVLEGIPEGEQGVITMPLGKTSSAAQGWRMVPDPAGKSAITRWRVRDVQNGRALVEFIPETGRTHQIRVHAREGLGFGIVGDPVYGGIAPTKTATPMLLHSLFLSVPRDNKPPAEATAPLPPRFAEAGFALPA